MIMLSSPSSFFDLALASDKLRVPTDTVLKLRRAIDPTLTFDEHRDIFPLDLGPVWNLASLSATKPIARENICPDKSEWNDIIEQFRIIFTYGLTAGNPGINFRTHFFGMQSVLTVGYPQITGGIHIDGPPGLLSPETTRSAFRESWSPPDGVVLIARDIEPTTLGIKCFDAMPADLILMEFDGQIQFDDERLIKKAKAENKLVEFTAGHVIAIPNRVLHGGRPAHTPCKQTVAIGGLGWDS